MDFDLVVIGAGIHGASLARDAAQRGWRVLLLEQYSGPGQGTSSKSSKLIHGGLRYLESGQIRLVRECLVERRRLLREQSDLVRLVPFHIPVYEHTHRKTWMIALGLNLYRLLGGKDFKHVERCDWPQLDGLKTQGLKRVFRYWDAQTDDLRLTTRLVQQAEGLGARVRYGATFRGAECSRRCCTIFYRAADGGHELETRTVVNASGPWVNLVLEKFRPALPVLDIDLVQGTHIVIPGALRRGIYYIEAPADRRAVFVMPWKGHTMVGTTETPYHGDPANVRPLEAEIEYLLDTRNAYFADPVRREQVIDSFAGLRVLPVSARRLFDRSRETRLHHARKLENVISIYGGKLTSHHHTAQRVLKQLAKAVRKSAG